VGPCALKAIDTLADDRKDSAYDRGYRQAIQDVRALIEVVKRPSPC